jgi:glycosyltransferase involved in cell wall biosynthesis
MSLDAAMSPRTAMSVLHVAQPVDGGVAAYVLAASLDQAARGWDVAVACPDEGRLPAELDRSGITRLSWRAVRGPGPTTAAEGRRLADLAAGYPTRVVHLHASKAGLAGRLYLRRRPLIFQPHGWSWLAVTGPLRAASRAWERAATRWTDALICVGEEEAEQGRAAGVRGRYTVVRNGVDLHRFQPADDRARARARYRLAVDPDRPLAVCVGRVTRQKGQDVLLAAWPRVRRECPDAELALVGAGDLLPALRAGAPEGVRFAGAVTDVRDWLAAADLVVLPSRWEGLPLTALEAMATGRAVVASAVPGLVEVVAPAVGALVEPEAPEALAEQVGLRLRDRARSAREGRAAARHATGFDERLTFARLAEATQALVETRAGVPAWQR